MRKKPDLTKIKTVQEYDASEGVFELANYDIEFTGLPMVIWIGPKNAQHGPRIKVQRNYVQRMDPNNLFCVSVTDKPKIVAGNQGEITNIDLQKIFKWIILNKIVLLKVWNMEYKTFVGLEKDLIKV